MGALLCHLITCECRERASICTRQASGKVQERELDGLGPKQDRLKHSISLKKRSAFPASKHRLARSLDGKRWGDWEGGGGEGGRGEQGGFEN